MSTRSIADLLGRGLEWHRLGDLDRAAEAYGEVLTLNPDQPEAAHLIGIVAAQRGEFEPAARSIARAIALRPAAAHFHANLGEVYRAIGQSRRAAACQRVARRLCPEGFDGPGDHDVLIRAEGSPDLPFEPAGRGAGLAPGPGEAHLNLGRALYEARRLKEALFHCGEAVRLSPGHAPAWNNLGNVLRELGRTTEAKASYAEALRVDPDMTVVYLNLGRLVQDEGRLKDAETWFRIALGLEPDSVEIRWSLANALELSGRYDEAASLCEQALALDPNSAESLVCLGSVRHAQGRLDDAVRHFRDATRANPGYVPAHCSLGVVLGQGGDFEGAERSFRDALRLPADRHRTLNELAKLLRGKLPQADLDAIERLIADPDLPDNKRADLHLGAAEVLDARGDYAPAAEHVRRGKGIRRAETVRAGTEYRPEPFEAFVDGMVASCPTEFFERVQGLGLSTDRPVFVFGLPRSGTTLTEQILAAHSQVHGAGELPLARMGFDSLPAILELPVTAERALGAIDRESADRLARAHLARLDEIGRGVPLVVDKMPENYHYLGYLAVLFPRARFIHCRRDLRDVGVSCWFTNFRDIRWVNDLDHIAARFAGYRRLMAHWSATLPVPILEIDYEETVADLEGTARRLLDWCGLDWEPDCLSFHRPRNPVKTASTAQVRQPIYTRSVGRWKHYQDELGPLFDRLVPILAAMV